MRGAILNLTEIKNVTYQLLESKGVTLHHLRDYFYRRSVCQATYKYRVIVCRYSFYTYFLCIRCR